VPRSADQAQKLLKFYQAERDAYELEWLLVKAREKEFEFKTELYHCMADLAEERLDQAELRVGHARLETRETTSSCTVQNRNDERGHSCACSNCSIFLFTDILLSVSPIPVHIVLD
jgi:hypothetical protein